MIYKFKSRATPDLIMMGPHGDHLLQLIGKTPAPQGIVSVAQLPAAIEALKAAVAADERQRAEGNNPPEGAGEDEEADDGPQRGDPVGLRQRVWPMVLMMTHALAEQQDIVWGV
ncbi:MAG: DUF1840 domain-containing protein [Pseudomonadota bacterium]